MNSLGSERCWAEVDCAALRHNARLARERIGPGDRAARGCEGEWLRPWHGRGRAGFARRGRAFRRGELARGDGAPRRWYPASDFILGPSLPEERGAINKHGFIATVSSWEEACAFERNPAGVNFAIDTGMGRMGCWQDDAVAELEKISRIPELKLHSVSTHLPVADEDAAFTKEELVRFEDIVKKMRARVPGPYRVHALLSAGILCFSEHKFDLVRAGLMLYGSSPVPSEQRFLQPVMALKSRVALLRDLPAGRSLSYGRTFTTSRPMRVATITAGYADGYRRSLSNREAAVLIGGRRCPGTRPGDDGPNDGRCKRSAGGQAW